MTNEIEYVSREAKIEETPSQYITIPYPGLNIRQRGINSTHGTTDLRAHFTPAEIRYITETSKMIGLKRAALIRWLVNYGCRAVRKLNDGKDHDPNPV